MNTDKVLDWMLDTKLGLLTRLVMSAPIAFAVAYGFFAAFAAI